MHRKIRIMSHLPEFYQGVREFEAFAKSEDTEFSTFAEFNAADLADAFILTASESSILIWEKEIGIRADPSCETLDFRRKRLIIRYTTKPPFTIRWIENQLRELLGDGFLRAERDDDVEILTVFADLDSLSVLLEFDVLIEAVLPLSMQYFKVFKGKRNIPAGIFAGSTNPLHLHIEVQPA